MRARGRPWPIPLPGPHPAKNNLQFCTCCCSCLFENQISKNHTPPEGTRAAHISFSRCQNSPEMSITTHDTGQRHSLNVCLPGAEKNLWNQTSEGHTSAGLPREWRRAPFIVAHFRHTREPVGGSTAFCFFLLNYSLFYARGDASVKCRT